MQKEKTKKQTTFFFIIITIIVLFPNCSRNPDGYTIKKGVLMIGMEIGYPPMEYYGLDGKTLMGFDVEMGKAIADKLGLEAEYIDVTWDGLFSGVETKRYDCIISSVTITPERINAHNFSKPYIVNSISIITLKNSAVKPRSPQELEGLAVAYQAETTSKFFTAKLLGEGLKFIPFEYEKVMNCFDELLLGRVDAVVADSIGALDYTAVQNSQFEITWLGEPDQFFGICIRKDNDTLTEAIDKALDDLFDEGTMRRISLDNLKTDMVSAVR